MRKPSRVWSLFALATATCLALAFLAFVRRPPAEPGPPIAEPVAGGDESGGAIDEEERFAAILRYWREEVRPNEDVASHTGYMADGPHGNRMHVPVPTGCEALCDSPFLEEFLRERLGASDPLTRKVAQDLLLLRLSRVFSYSGRMGAERGRVVGCTFVVVQGEEPGVDP